MAVSDVSICNYALAMIGAKQITNLDNTTVEGRQCLARFSMARDSILEMFPWTFAVSQASLARTAETPLFGYNYNYALPTKCLRPLRIVEEANYDIVSRNLMTDSETVSLWFVQQITDATQFTPLFSVLLASRLAKDMAMALTGNKDAKESAAQEYSQAFIEAVNVNADADNIIDESIQYASVRD